MPKLTRGVTEVRITCGKASCKVSRAYVLARPGGRIRFANRTGGDVHVHMSERRLCDDDRFTIERGGTKSVMIRKVQRGLYPYAVFCDCCGKFCTGSSMPIIIIPTSSAPY